MMAWKIALVGIFLTLAAATGVSLRAFPAFPLKTAGRHIIDAHGARVRLACVNWSGAAQKDGVVGGLQHQPADAIAALFSKQGFNCVRLPFSVWMVHADRPVHNARQDSAPRFVD